MICPFKVGDRIHEVRAQAGFGHGPEYPVESEPVWELDESKPDATVTALTARGFAYRYDRPIQFVRPDWGMAQGGEVYEEGFQFWRKIKENTAIERIRHLVACYRLSNYFNPGGAEFWTNLHPQLPHCQISAMDDEEDLATLVAWVARHRDTLDTTPFR